jgi:CubicO group peptidase (beta-lactamase class C family)
LFKLAAASLLLLHLGDGLPSKAPDAVGMSAERLRTIDRVVSRGISAGGYPGAAVVVGRKGFSVYQRGFGKLGWTADSPRVTAERTIYDLASLTKVVGTATAAMILWDEGKLDLDAPVTRYIPEFTGGRKDEITVRQLLTHRSGMRAGIDLWRVSSTREQARAAVLASDLACSPGACYIYSDLGAITLGFVVEAISGQSLDVFLHERVFAPLGMTDTYFRPADSLRTRIAPTEIAPPRGYPLRGEVHDENAYSLGGIAGHAGMFSTAADLSVFAQMMLNGGEYNGVRIASDSAVTLFTKRTAGTRALGWDTGDGRLGAGEYMNERSYGHTGYTGTSMWIDPDRNLFVILLTNRVHAARARRPATVISDVRADLSDAAALAVTEDPEHVLAMPTSFRADRAEGWNRPQRVAKKKPVRRSSKSKAAVAVSRKASASAAAKKKAAASASKSKSKSTAAKKSTTKKASTKAAASKSSTSKAKSSKAKTTAKKPVKKPVTRKT